MALVRLVERDEVPTEVQAMFDAGEKQYGTVLHTWRAIAHRPDTFRAYVPYLRAVAGPGVLDQRIKELTALEVGLDNHCPYSVSHRVRAARAAGITDDELRALGDGTHSAFTEREQLALDVAGRLTLDLPSTPYDVEPSGLPKDIRARLQEAFTEEEIVELLLNISLWNALARFHRSMGFELDLEPVPDFLAHRM
jgi:AhpD family alkylhydroperoxidase